MTLPRNFQFSQSSLQDFVTCRRRFELRYLRQQRWPAIPVEPAGEADRFTGLGHAFHRLIHQHLIGLDELSLTGFAQNLDPQLQQWWSGYLTHRPALLDNAAVYPELTLTVPLGNYRLLARFDVVAALGEGAFLIIDWKTTRKKPRRARLAARLQTVVYPYVLAGAGVTINDGRAIEPGDITTMYWYPEFPAEPEVFPYSQARFEQDEETLIGLIDRVEAEAKTSRFPRTEEVQACRYCIYRSLCDRGTTAGPVDEQQLEADSDTPIDDTVALEQISEIFY
jgi:hypothetical protein